MNFSCATYIAGRGPKQEPQLEVNSAKDRVIELKKIAKNMESELQAWVNELTVSRSKYYKLNYYTTLQVLRLRKELGQSSKSIGPEVLSLLHSISAGLDSEPVRSVVTEVVEKRESISKDVEVTASIIENTKEQVTEDHNEAIESTSEDHKPLQRTFKEEEVPISQPSPTTSEVQDAGSSGLTEDALNEKQKEIFDDLTAYSGYDKLLVLKAIEEYPDADQYDIETWCDENEGTFEHEQEQKEDTTSPSESEESSSSDTGTSLSETEIANAGIVYAAVGYLIYFV